MNNTFISQATLTGKLTELKKFLAINKDRITYLEAELKLKQVHVLRLEAQIEVVESLTSDAQWMTYHNQIKPISFSTLSLNTLKEQPIQINGSNPNFHCSSEISPLCNWSSISTSPLPSLTSSQLASLISSPVFLTTESLSGIVAKAETTKKPKISKWNGWTLKNQ